MGDPWCLSVTYLTEAMNPMHVVVFGLAQFGLGRLGLRLELRPVLNAALHRPTPPEPCLDSPT